MLIVDTCIVIEAHRLDVWQAMMSQCDLLLPETVVGECILVAREMDDVHLRLEKDLEEGLVRSLSLQASELRIVANRCPRFPGKIDAGELECLALLLQDSAGTSLICSSDAVVFRYLGWLQLRERGVSLEEVLRKSNLGLRLPKKLTKSFREKWTAQGFAEAFQSGFLKA